MRMLIFSTENFEVTKIKQAERTPKVEEPFTTKEKNALLIFIQINSKEDEKHIQEAVEEIKQAVKLTKYKKIILCPFAHLDFKIAKAEDALKIIKKIEKELSKTIKTTRVHFGSHKEVLLKIPSTKTQVIHRIIPKPKKRKEK